MGESGRAGSALGPVSVPRLFFPNPNILLSSLPIFFPENLKLPATKKRSGQFSLIWRDCYIVSGHRHSPRHDQGPRDSSYVPLWGPLDSGVCRTLGVRQMDHLMVVTRSHRAAEDKTAEKVRDCGFEKCVCPVGVHDQRALWFIISFGEQIFRCWAYSMEKNIPGLVELIC